MKQYLKRTKVIQISIFILLVISNLIMVLNSFLNIEMTNAIIDGNSKNFINFFLLVILFMALVSGLNYIVGLLKSKSKKEIAVLLRKDYLKNYMNNYDLSYKNETSQIISHLTNDINFVVDKGLDTRYQYWNFGIGVVLPLLGAAYIHWSFIIVFPISLALSLAIVKKLNPIIEMTSQEQSDENKKFVATLDDLFKGFSTLFAYKALKGFNKKIMQSNMDLENKKERFSRKMTFVQSMMMLSMILSQSIYILDAGYLVIHKVLTAGTIVGLMSLAQGFYSNFQNAMQTKMYILSTNPILNKLLSEVNIGEKDLKNIDKVQSTIDIKNLTYRYANEELPLMKNKSYSFSIGKKYMINGISGSGKSTLLKLLSGRIKDYDGDIFYDSLNIKELSSDTLTNLISYVDQDVYIFEDTIKNNITLGKEVSENEYERAITIAQLKDYIDTKAEKDNFLLTADGGNLSGGQRQRIAIARAVLYGKQILMIDEGLQGLDDTTADMVENALLKLPVTLFMVSHRKCNDLLTNYDSIIDINVV